MTKTDQLFIEASFELDLAAQLLRTGEDKDVFRAKELIESAKQKRQQLETINSQNE